MLSEDLRDLGQPHMVGDLQKVDGAARHLLTLINDILDLSKVEAEKMTISPTDVDAAGLLKELVDLMRPRALANHVAMEVELDPSVGAVHVDAGKVRQIVLNLLSNAVKFTENGTVVLRARLEETGHARTLVVEVRDTGIGMSPEVLGRVFKPFVQADPSTTRRYGGTGLGLAICRAFAELLGGDIHAESTEGVGSTLRLRLPVGQAHYELEQLGLLGTGRGPVLVVNDDPDARDLLCRHLRKCGYRVLEAASGEEAIELAKAKRPSAITLDVMMPELDGWGVLHALKDDAELADIPVVMVTMTDDRERGFAFGASAFVAKPVDGKQLGGGCSGGSTSSRSSDASSSWKTTHAPGRSRAGPSPARATRSCPPRTPTRPSARSRMPVPTRSSSI